MKKTPLRVLIVEDSEDDALLLVRELERGGFEVQSERVETAETMVAALQRQEWDIVLSDYRMPHFSGPAALKVFQQSALDIPFFVLSGTVGEDVAVDMLRAGAHDYIMKHNLIRLIPDVKRELLDAEVRRAKRLAEERIVHLNSVLRAMRAVNQLIVREKDPDRLIKEACDCLVGERGFFSAWIVLLDDAGSFRTAAEAGLGERSAPLMAHLKQKRLPRCVKNALGKPGALTAKADKKECADCPLVTACLGRELLVCRLQSAGKSYGVLAVCVRPEFGEDPEERSLFEEAAGDVAFGLRGIEIEQERRRAEEAEKRLLAILENTPDYVSTSLSDAQLLYLNTGGRRLIGVPPDEDVTRMQIPNVHPKWASEKILNEGIPAAVRDGVWSGDTALLSRDGREIPVSQVIIAHRSPEGNLEYLSTIMRDISERKRAEQELRESVHMLRRVLEETVASLASAVEHRDPYTAGHQKRVAELACAMGAAMGLDEQRLTGLRLAATIHDVGKVYVPAEILSMPRRLTPAEFSLIQAHCEAGHSILKGIEFPWPVAEAVLQHHERMDGSGYPRKLSGEGILLEARIIAVADVVEAMSSHRPYRPALGVDAALAEITKGAGRLFDPAVAAYCVKLMREGGFKMEEAARG